MPEFSERASSYREMYKNWEELQELATDPDLAEVVSESIDTAVLAMDSLAPQAEPDFIAALEPPVTPETLETIRKIENLRNTKPYKDGLISEESIQARLAALPRSEPYPEDDTKFAKAYWVGKHFASKVGKLSIIQRDTETSAPQPETTAQPVEPEPGAPEQESNRTPLKVVVYKGNNVLLVGNKPMPLSRRMGGGTSSVEDETFVEECRLRAIEYIADHPNEPLRAKDIWDHATLGIKEFYSMTWQNYIGDFLRDDLVYKGQPLINVDKVQPRLIMYSLGDFDLKFEHIEEAYDDVLLGIAKLPNGQTMGGKVALAFQLLLKATQDKPLITNDLVKFGVYTTSEIAKRKDGKYILSSTTGSIMSALREKGLGDLYELVSVRTDDKRPGKGTRTEPGYYLREKVSDGAVKAPIEADEEAPEHELTLRKGALLTQYFNDRGRLLEHLGIPAIPEEVVEAFENADIQFDSRRRPATQQEIDARRTRVYAILSNAVRPENLTELLDSFEVGDPRLGLIDYVYDRLNDEATRPVFEAALRARGRRIFVNDIGNQPTVFWGVAYDFDDGREPVQLQLNYEVNATDSTRHGATFESEDDEAEILEKRAQYIAEQAAKERLKKAQQQAEKEQALAEATPNPVATAPVPEQQPSQTEKDSKRTAKKASKRAQKSSESNGEWEKDWRHKIGETISQLEEEGLMVEGTISARNARLKGNSTIFGTKTNMERLQTAGLLSLDTADVYETPVTAENMIAMKLYNNSRHELGKGSPRQKKAVEIVKQCVESYFAAHRQASET